MAYKRPGGGLTATQQAAKFLGVSVLAGTVLAGLALPATGLLGLTAKGTVSEFDDIPADLKTPPLSQKTTILDREGGHLADVYSRNRTVVEFDDIAPVMRQAIVAIEDERFYEHGAVDLQGILRALSSNAQSGTVSEGASTLTQQYVKNVFVEEAGNDAEKVAAATRQTVGRKIQELKYAIQVEKELTKDEILENYLNIAFFGQQAYGIEAAAERYFSKSADKLDLAESAMLAGLVQLPSRYDPITDPEAAKKRRNTVLRRMVSNDYVTRAEAAKAMDKPLGLKVSQPRSGCITAVSGAGFFCDYVREVLLKDKGFGETRKQRVKRWNRGGLTIRTTLDPTAQESANESIKSHVYQDDTVATAVTVVEPGSGKIRAMGQSRPYGSGKNETMINLSVEKSMNGSNYGFQVGSTFKPLTAAAALEKGVPNTKVYPSPNEMPYPSPVETCEDGKNWVNTEGSDVENETEEEVGPYSMREATAKSINTYFVSLISDIGICPVKELAQSMGVHRGDGGELEESPSLTLGGQTIAPLAMANAYATFANRGEYCSPIAIESMKDAKGRKLPVPKSQCKRVMSQKTAGTINTLLSGVVEDGTGQQAGLTGRDNAGKTGTTDERKAAWFVGYTSDLAGAVWVGGPTDDVSMENIQIGPTYHARVFGGAVPGPIWRDAMDGALAGKTSPALFKVPVAADRPKKDDDEDEDDDEDDKPSNPLGGLLGGGGNGGGGGGNSGGGNGGGSLDGGTADGGLDGGWTDGGNGNSGPGGWPDAG
ncbi:transglycosylase domain-containing protein [Streptomyces synnematoformans]|uniref:Transglycosylase domain-containing protein n=1 Tax=Streptomyces synnematoformans TaxID=415721 RepID=A0ABP5JEY1_9ACTN